jgi:hypothetical protein
MTNKIKVLPARFNPGRIAATDGVMAKIDGDYAIAALAQHIRGQWGTLDEEDWAANDAALRNGGRLLSVYPLQNEAGDFWIITDRSGQEAVTTLLLPNEY